MTNNLNLTQMTEAQNSKEVTHNDSNGELDAAITGKFSVLVNSSNAATLAIADLRRANLITIDNDSPAPTNAITITVTAMQRGSFAILNNTSFTVTAEISGQTADSPTVAPGEAITVTTDGTDLYLAGGAPVAAAGGGGGGATAAVAVSAEFGGAMAKRSGDLLAQDYTGAGAAILWDDEEYDTDAFHSTVSNISRLTVPAGVTKIVLSSTVQLTSVDASDHVLLWLSKNGNFFNGSGRTRQEISSTDAIMLNVSSGVLNVVPGDYFEANLVVEADTSVNVVASVSHFSIQVVERDDTVNLQSAIAFLQPRHKGALLVLSANKTAQDLSAPNLIIDWDAEVYDTGFRGVPFHDNVTNNSRITIPAGVTKVQIEAGMHLQLATAGEWSRISIFKNGFAFQGGGLQYVEVGNTDFTSNVSSAVLEVVEGDFFEVQFQVEADTSITIEKTFATYFGLTVVETDDAADVPTAFIALDKPHKGAVVKIDSDITAAVATDTALPWDSAVTDTKFDPNDTGPEQKFWLGVNATITAAADDNVTLTSHGMSTGDGPFQFTTSAADLPAGLAVLTDYWAIRIDNNTFQVATSRANALAGTQVDITDAGTGTHTIDRETRLIVPAGVAKVELLASFEAQSDLAGDGSIHWEKNGAAVTGGGKVQINTAGPEVVNLRSTVLTVAEGDVFELVYNVADASTIDATNNFTFAQIKVVETSFITKFPGVTVSPPHMGARLQKGTLQTVTTDTGTKVVWDAGDVVFDTGAYFDNANDEFLIPAGVTKVRLVASVDWGPNTTGGIRQILMRKNGTTAIATHNHPPQSDGGSTIQQIETGVIEVVEGDNFQLDVFHDRGADLTVDAIATTFFAIDIIETDEAARPPEPIDIFLENQHWDLDAIPVSQPVYKKIATRRFSLLDDFANSQGQADAGPNGGAVVFDVLRNGTSIGSITFADSTGAAQTATFSTTGATQEDFEIGDRLEIETPANVQSINEVVISLWAFRS
jgi:hypothetical protein